MAERFAKRAKTLELSLGSTTRTLQELTTDATLKTIAFRVQERNTSPDGPWTEKRILETVSDRAQHICVHSLVLEAATSKVLVSSIRDDAYAKCIQNFVAVVTDFVKRWAETVADFPSAHSRLRHFFGDILGPSDNRPIALDDSDDEGVHTRSDEKKIRSEVNDYLLSWFVGDVTKEIMRGVPPITPAARDFAQKYHNARSYNRNSLKTTITNPRPLTPATGEAIFRAFEERSLCRTEQEVTTVKAAYVEKLVKKANTYFMILKPDGMSDGDALGFLTLCVLD